MTTTQPQTTTASVIPTPLPTDSCQISLPDYTVLRTQNFKKINDYYNTLLDSYTKNYTEYATQSASLLANDKAYAETTLKPKVADYNKQVINLNQNLINNVNQDTDLITDQKNQLTTKMTTIDTLMSNIQMLKDKDTEMTVVSSARKDSLNSTKIGTDDMQFNTYIYIGICILLVLLIIGLIFYLVYSGYSNQSNSNKINNTGNTSRNIGNSKTTAL